MGGAGGAGGATSMKYMSGAGGSAAAAPSQAAPRTAKASGRERLRRVSERPAY